MQQAPTQQEERYADGLGEYSSFYGGPSYNYLASPKMVSTSVREMQPQPSVPEYNRHSAATHLQRTISYDLAANDPETRRAAEGLQISHRQSPRPGHFYDPRGYVVEDEGLHLAQQHPIAGYQPRHAPRHVAETRHQHPKVDYTMPSTMPAPLNYSRRTAGIETPLHHFPQPPTSPTSPTSPHSPLSPTSLTFQKQKPPPNRQLPPLPRSPDLSAPPQPLKFQRANTLPPTPPQSHGARTNDEMLHNQMQSLNLGEPYILGKQSLAPTKFPLSRMNTMSSLSSGRSSLVPGSPFDQHNRISVAHTDATMNNILEHGPPELSPAEAHAEVLRLLDKADETSSRKSGSTVKKGFSLRRSNTSKPANNNASHSQDALTDVLEDVAEEGSLPKVKAVVALGADPVYRTSGKMKKVKHEALAKATAAGRAGVVDFLLSKGASYGEAQKKAVYTPIDRALLTAVYAGHAELAGVLIAEHGANPMIEQWPREMEDAQHYWAQNPVRLAKTSVIDGISHWKSEEQAMSVLRAIMKNPKFDPTVPVSGVFDNKSELQSAEFAHRPWNTTYEYSTLACFARAGWADAVEELLSINSSPAAYEKEDEVLQYQDKVTRFVSPVNALTKDTWQQRPEEALRILRLLIDRGFNIALVQRSANDLGQRTPLARALAANAAQAVELISQTRPELVKEVISFRRNKKETKAQPLAAALALEKLETARVLLRAGAHPRDPAFEFANVLDYAAHTGGETCVPMLAEMLHFAPELTYSALDTAIRRINNACVRVLLDAISAAANRNEIAALPALWDMLLALPSPASSLLPNTEPDYFALINLIHTWDSGSALPRPQLPSILTAIRKDNYAGMQRLLELGVVQGDALVLNCKARPVGEQGSWSVLECCEETGRAEMWLGLLRGYGAPLFT